MQWGNRIFLPPFGCQFCNSKRLQTPRGKPPTRCSDATRNSKHSLCLIRHITIKCMVLLGRHYPVPKNFTTGQWPLIKVNSIKTQVEGISPSQSKIHANKLQSFSSSAHVITMFVPRQWQKKKQEDRGRWWMQVGKKSNCYQLNSNRIQPDHVKLWGKSVVQLKQPNHNIASENKNGITAHIQNYTSWIRDGKLSPWTARGFMTNNDFWVSPAQKLLGRGKTTPSYVKQ
jgi:hypothetical protein